MSLLLCDQGRSNGGPRSFCQIWSVKLISGHRTERVHISTPIKQQTARRRQTICILRRSTLVSFPNCCFFPNIYSQKRKIDFKEKWTDPDVNITVPCFQLCAIFQRDIIYRPKGALVKSILLHVWGPQTVFVRMNEYAEPYFSAYKLNYYIIGLSFPLFKVSY